MINVVYRCTDLVQHPCIGTKVYHLEQQMQHYLYGSLWAFRPILISGSSPSFRYRILVDIPDMVNQFRFSDKYPTTELAFSVFIIFPTRADFRIHVAETLNAVLIQHTSTSGIM